MNYVPLYVKTSYSLLSSLCDIKKLIERSKELNIKALAITDDNMFGTLEFYKECLKNDIKPIIGISINFKDQLVLLYAKNYKGYQNLTKLIYLKQKKEIELSDLKELSNNVLCIVDSSEMYNELSKIYVNIYLGYNNDYEEKKVITSNLVFINQVLSLRKEDVKYLKYLYLIKDGKKIDSINDYVVEENCYLEYNNQKEDKTDDIVDMLNIEFKYNKELFPTYLKDIDSKEYLFELSKKGLIKRFGTKVKKIYYDRLMYELEVIDSMDFNDCFLIVWDYVKYARNNNILIGPGRGSAACSLVSYCLGITEVDPIKYDLVFERFLNKERISMPDIDIDFESNNRDKVIEYVIDKYSNIKTVPIITFSTLSGKQILRDIGRIMEIDTKKIDLLSKLITKNDLNYSYSNNKEFKGYIELNNYEDYVEVCLKLEGLKRQISLHAAGLIFSNLELDSYIPLQKYNDIYISGYSMEHLEELGLLKMDLLGIKDLTLIDKILKSIDIKFSEIPMDDMKSIMIFQNAYTDGIFQFESEGMKNFLKKLKPDNFNDIVAAIALFRPGPSSNIDSYIRRKQGKEKIDYLHEDLVEILSPTYGIIIYQEQIMKIANKIAGYSLGEADVLRRAISKKKKEILEKEEKKFIERSIEEGYEKDIAKTIYDFIYRFADYGFNKAHSVGYSIMAYRMAYLKANYSLIYMSELLNSVLGQEEKTRKYIEECKKMNIKIRKPNINESCCNYIVKDGVIVYSLVSIKNMGSTLCKQIIEERNKGLYEDYFDFVARNQSILNKKILESLIDSGSLDSFGYNHNTLYSNIENALNYGELYKNLGNLEKPLIKIYDEYSREDLSKKEINALGIYLSNHPASTYKSKFENIIDSTNIKEYFDKEINLILVIDYIKEIDTKNNKKMAFFKCSDEFGSVDLVVFPNVFENIAITKDMIIYVKGRVERNISKYQVVVSDLKIL